MALLQKFASGSRGQPADQELVSIVENLNNILNTKRHYGSLLSDLGIRDLSEHRTRDDIALAVMREVRECIERYEPRVCLEQIVREHDDNPMRLSFTIQCSIRRDARTLKMVFDTLFGNVAVGGPANQ